jgi:hypothetical protein
MELKHAPGAARIVRSRHNLIETHLMALGAAAVMLMACGEGHTGSPSGGTRAPAIDRSKAAKQIFDAMRDKRFNDYIGDTYRCANFFALAGVAYTAERIEGTTAKVEVQATIQRLPTRGGIQNMSANESAEKACYGAPPGGWTPNQFVSGAYIADFELWGTEWRMVGVPRNRDVR